MRLSPAETAKCMAMASHIDGKPVNAPLCAPSPRRRCLRRPPDLVEAAFRVTGLEVVVPLQTRSEANLRSWKGRSRRTKEARQTWTALALKLNLPIPPLPAVVTFTRVGGKLMDDDGIQAAFKGLRDTIARWLTGTPEDKPAPDGPNDPIRWEYADQHPGVQIGVWVSIRSVDEV